jgi:hypothetical protein
VLAFEMAKCARRPVPVFVKPRNDTLGGIGGGENLRK